MNRLIIIGAGGHGKVLADNAQKNGYTDVFFVDDYASGACVGFPIIGKIADIESFNDGKTDFIIGIGNNEIRKNIANRYDVHWITLIHPSAQVGIQVSVGRGCAVMAGAVINACTTIGEHCIINSGAVVEHDNQIGDFVHISPGACVAGFSSVGESTWVGVGASVINKVRICENCTIGAGAVVLKSIEESGTYVGIPASEIE